MTAVCLLWLLVFFHPAWILQSSWLALGVTFPFSMQSANGRRRVHCSSQRLESLHKMIRHGLRQKGPAGGETERQRAWVLIG
ncbi:hypothetical protein BJ166DRAFT_507450 [Pestalotiopsis sp. NC0098]|nr:hypothetical protein BJ166DRAFT_507450 [Pestalotiopsis sp. NC0098]